MFGCRGKGRNGYTEWNDVARPRDLDGSTMQRVLNVQRC